MVNTNSNKRKNLDELGLPKPYESEVKKSDAFEVDKDDNSLSKEAAEVVQEGQETLPKTTKIEQPEVPDKAVAPEQEQASVAQQATVAQDQPDELEEKIEEIMSEDLGEEYQKMSPKQQEKFKEVGEETAGKIRKMLLKSRINVKKIIDLLVKWLKLIPGINKFFLQQEAKIKADKIIEINDKNSSK